MSHTNKTTHYNLPQFIGTDKPGWLTDVNQSYQDIDEAIYQADTAAQGAQVTADSANSAIQTVNADLQTAKTQLDTTTTVANQAQATNVTQGQQIATNATGITNINARLGNKDISAIGDGTITGAIEAIEQAIEQGGGHGELADDVTQAGTSAVKSSGIYSFVNGRTGGLTFGQDASGNWGYKVGGADPVIPFRGSFEVIEVQSAFVSSPSAATTRSFTAPADAKQVVMVTAPNDGSQGTADSVEFSINSTVINALASSTHSAVKSGSGAISSGDTANIKFAGYGLVICIFLK